MGSVTFGRERLLHHMTIARAMSVRHPSRCFPIALCPRTTRLGFFPMYPKLSYVPERRSLSAVHVLEDGSTSFAAANSAMTASWRASAAHDR
jgi:hypothetical protein